MRSYFDINMYINFVLVQKTEFELTDYTFSRSFLVIENVLTMKNLRINFKMLKNQYHAQQD